MCLAESGDAAMRDGDATLAETPAHANGAMPGSAPSDMAGRDPEGEADSINKSIITWVHFKD